MCVRIQGEEGGGGEVEKAVKEIIREREKRKERKQKRSKQAHVHFNILL
jgi:hypothetical protein